LKQRGEWPALKRETGWRSLVGSVRPRTKAELIDEMNGELNSRIIGVNWNFSQNIRDNVMESLSGVKGDNSVKIFGPDLDRLERLADLMKNRLEGVSGIENVGVFRIKGQSNLELLVDKAKCKYWSVAVADVNNAIKTAI